MKLCVHLYCIFSIPTVVLYGTSALWVDDKCHNGVQEGVCTLEPDCPTVTADIDKFGDHNYTRCGFDDVIEIVCCPAAITRKKNPTGRKSEAACDRYAKKLPVILGYQIAGGRDAKLGEFPHMAALGLYDDADGVYSFECGASLISDKYLVTAAHCVLPTGYRVPKVVRMGVVNLPQTTTELDPAVDHQIKNFSLHNYGKAKNDIALVELQKSVTFSDHLRPACLYTREEVPQVLVITGWGDVDLTSKRPTTLQAASVTLVPFQKCVTTDTCSGDSGGPIQMLDTNVYVLVGVTALGGRSCGNTLMPSAYTKIYEHLSWIENTVWP